MKLISFLGAVGLLSIAGASPIPVRNGSFEEPALSPGVWSNELFEWEETGGPGNGAGFQEHISGFAADGNQHLGVVDGHDVWQDLGFYFEEFGFYELTVAIGRRGIHTSVGNESTFSLADSGGAIHGTGVLDASTVPDLSFQDAALGFHSADAPSSIGKEIRTLLQARGNLRSHFDHVRLSGPRTSYTQAVLADRPVAYYQFNGTPKAPHPGPPRIVSVEPRSGNTRLVVTYSEPVDPISAGDPFSYALFNLETGTNQSITVATLGASSGEVIVDISANLPLDTNQAGYRLYASDVFDEGRTEVLTEGYKDFVFAGEGRFPARDSSGRGNHGMCANGTVPGPVDDQPLGMVTGSAATFDGDDDLVETPALFSGAPAATFEAWLRIDADVALGCCVSLFSPDGFPIGTPHFNLRPGYAAEIGVAGANPGNQGAGPLPQGEWFHLAVVYDSAAGATGTAEFFVNGESLGGPRPYAVRPPALNVGAGQIGGWLNDLNRNFTGALDEVAIYDRALGCEEIRAHYEARMPIPDPIVHYRLSEANEAAVAEGVVANHGSGGDGLTGGIGSVVTLSPDVPTAGVPSGAGTRSIDCAGVGGIRTPGTLQLSNEAIAAAGGFTMEAWFKYMGGGNVNSIIDYAGTEKLDRQAVGTGPRMQTNNGVVHAIGSAGIGEWHYVAAVFTPTAPVAPDGTLTGDYTYYLDGLVPVRTEPSVTKTTFGDGLNRTIGVGMHPLGFAGDWFNGLIFEPRVTLGALQPSQLLFRPAIELTSVQVERSTGDLSVTWTSQPGLRYRIEGGDDLQSWETIATCLGSDGESTTVVIPGVGKDPARAQAFYVRVGLE